MKKTIVVWIVATALLSACTSNTQKYHDSGVGFKATTDNRINDPIILKADTELQQGDLGLGEKDTNKDGSFQAKSIRIFKLVHPNYSIRPLKGGYANNAISFGARFLGTPYQFGSNRNNPDTFDCSDFTRYAFLGALGMDLPKDSRSQARYVQTYGKRKYWNLGQAQRGDLLFFMSYRGFRPENYRGINKASQRITHCGIYLGNGRMLHTASNATGGVRIDNIWGKHLQWRFISGGSVLP
jgi:cell wall-associated NlpC family hydrolase